MGAGSALVALLVQLAPLPAMGSPTIAARIPENVAIAAVDSSVDSAAVHSTVTDSSAADFGASGSSLSDSAAVSLSPDSTAAQTKPTPKQRTIAGRATHTVKSLVSDVGYVVTSPLRFKLTGILLTAAGLGATALCYSYDNEIHRGFKRSQGNGLYDSMIDVGNDFEGVGFMGDTWPYWVGGAVVSTAIDFDPLQSLCLDVIESHLIAGGARNLAKFVVGRKHPFESGRSEFFVHGTSMPSGHTSVVFEIATVLTRHTHGWPVAGRVAVGIATYGIATAVGMQRVDSDAHWASDVLAGALQGTMVANTVVTRNKERRKKEGIAGGPTLAPTLDAAGQPAVALVWRY